MADTTNLDDLPSDPSVGNQAANVVLETNDKTNYNPNDVAPQAPGIQNQKIMNEMITGLQQASANGATKLPSRDMPKQTVHFADEEVKPNFVPQTENTDYINNTEEENEIMINRMRAKKDKVEQFYDEFQIPILICLLYFIFQLPIVKSKLLVMLPSLFNKDGNPNLSGYVINSIMFGGVFYVIQKTLSHLEKM